MGTHVVHSEEKGFRGTTDVWFILADINWRTTPQDIGRHKLENNPTGVWEKKKDVAKKKRCSLNSTSYNQQLVVE